MPSLSPRPLPAPPPASLVRMVLRLHGWLQGLTRRLLPPDVQIAELATGLAWSHALAAIVRAGVPDALNDVPSTAETLAARVHLDADMLHRTLRAMATRGIFEMDRDGRFAHTPASRALRKDHPSAVAAFSEYFASPSNAASWAAFDRTLQTGASAFESVHGMSVWAWFDRHADERETFAHAMAGMTRADAPWVASLYPFGEIDELCDVGGGRGILLSELLVRFPRLRGLLCDAAGVLDAARVTFEARGVAHRVELRPGSFFEGVPSGVDAYLLKNILHDWDDERARRILSVVRDAASPGARVLVVESLVGRLSRDPMGCGADLQMAVACSRGRERDVEEFQTLLNASGFAPGRVFRSPVIAVIEATAV
ncbi:MAG: methyltransferase [Vicinamibacterales bacterium]